MICKVLVGFYFLQFFQTRVKTHLGSCNLLLITQCRWLFLQVNKMKSCKRLCWLKLQTIYMLAMLMLIKHKLLQPCSCVLTIMMLTDINNRLIRLFRFVIKNVLRVFNPTPRMPFYLFANWIRELVEVLGLQNRMSCGTMLVTPLDNFCQYSNKFRVWAHGLFNYRSKYVTRIMITLTGTAMLILTSTESSESSYYGEQGLHFLALNGDSCVVPLGESV